MSEIQRYDVQLQQLIHPKKHKIRKILEYGCIKRISDDEHVCRPILGYNTTTYTMTRKPDGLFKCNCQGYATKQKKTGRGDCTHLQALYIMIGQDQKQGVLF